MKDSGVQWIGLIPDDWEIVRFKFTHQGSNVGESIDKNFCAENEGDIVFYTAGLNPIMTNYKDFPIWKYTDSRDLLLARNGTPYVYLPTKQAAYSDHIIRVKIQDGYSKRFIRYCLQQSIKNEVVDTVSITTWSVPIWDSQYLCIPSYSQQQKIADFLDKKCSEIQSAIDNTKQTIEEYKKLKQAVITKAVTKGIRENRKLKDSGIEWIGQIPEEWECRRIKTLFNLRSEKNYLPLEQVNLISLYTDLGVVQHADIEQTTGNKAMNADGYKKVYKDDIVVNIILCWMGAIGRSAYNGVTSPAYDVYQPQENVNSSFYHYYFRTKGFNGDCFKCGKGIMLMRWRTYSDYFRDIRVVAPSAEEQIEIVNYLDKKCSQIDTLISQKEQFITELEKYKQSLIYEYVTGKKEVK